MSNRTAVQATTIGDLAFESKVRADAISESGLRVYGVDRTDGLTPVAKYTSKNLGRYKVLRPGMFAYNPMRLNIGSIAYCTDKHEVGLVSPDYVVFGCVPGELDPDFFSYVIKGPEWRQWTAAAGVGSVRVRIYFRELAKMPITVPPLSEQKIIAQILGTLDGKIELNRRMNTTLEAMVRALFQSWFVDFDPVRAKLDGRKPAGLGASTAALFPSHFQESPLGHIPQGWEVTNLDAISNVGSGKRPTGRNDVQSTECSIPLYGGGGQMGFVSTSLYENPILFTGRVGTLGLIFRTADPSWPSDNTLIVEPQDDFFDFTYFVLKGFDLVTLNCGSTQPLLTQTDLKRQQFVLPPASIVKAFAAIAAPIFQQITENEKQSRTLTTLCGTLLPKLLSGEISVANVEEEFASV